MSGAVLGALAHICLCHPHLPPQLSGCPSLTISLIPSFRTAHPPCSIHQMTPLTAALTGFRRIVAPRNVSSLFPNPTVSLNLTRTSLASSGPGPMPGAPRVLLPLWAWFQHSPVSVVGWWARLLTPARGGRQPARVVLSSEGSVPAGSLGPNKAARRSWVEVGLAGQKWGPRGERPCERAGPKLTGLRGRGCRHGCGPTRAWAWDRTWLGCWTMSGHLGWTA